jgi:hypothetical protein
MLERCRVLVTIGAIIGFAQAAAAANDCRLSGTWVNKQSDEVYTFGPIVSGATTGKFQYSSKAWNLSYAGEYYFDNDYRTLNLKFVDDRGQQRAFQFNFVMDSPASSLFTIETSRANPVMPVGPQSFAIQSQPERILNLSLCNP